MAAMHDMNMSIRHLIETSRAAIAEAQETMKQADALLERLPWR
jgi:hypothetical protein